MVLLVNGERDVVEGTGDRLLLDSNVDCNDRSGKPIKGENKAGEYLVYPRVLRPTTKLLCMYQMERGGCIMDCKIENTRIRGNMLGLSKTSIFRRCLAAWGKKTANSSIKQ